MGNKRLGTYLGTHRKLSGLNQYHVATVIGLKKKIQITHYEDLVALPTLRTALALENLFCVPVSELFAGMNDTIKADVENNLRRLEYELQQTSGKGPQAAQTAHVLEWLEYRRRRIGEAQELQTYIGN
jgi:DNA-binding XRE family transcriptional regulator